MKSLFPLKLYVPGPLSLCYACLELNKQGKFVRFGRQKWSTGCRSACWSRQHLLSSPLLLALPWGLWPCWAVKGPGGMTRCVAEDPQASLGFLHHFAGPVASQGRWLWLLRLVDFYFPSFSGHLGKAQFLWWIPSLSDNSECSCFCEWTLTLTRKTSANSFVGKKMENQI